MESQTVARSVLRCCLSVFASLNASRLKPATAGAALTLALAGAFATGNAQATTAVGAIHGSAGVTATGAATYTIPIQISPGTNGMQPSLALTYDSQGGEGWAGYGWTLSGFSTITRCQANPEDDGVDGVTSNVPVRYTSSDDLCMDGQKLRLTGGTWAADGSTYGTQIEGFSLITAHAYTGITGGVGYFTVQTKDGRTYEYGNTTDSQIVAEGTTVIRVWALDKVTDANGNSMAYTYGSSPTAGRAYWPASITYTANGATAPDHEVDFTFVNRPWGVMTHYVHGSLYRDSVRLTTIVSKYSGTPVYTYNLSYEATAPVNNRNRLISVQECGADGSCFPSTSITWTSAHASWNSDTSTGISVTDPVLAAAAHLMDVDGDGIDDLVYPDDTVANGGTDDWMVAFGQPGGGFGTPVDTGLPRFGATGNALAMDYNGDGMADLIVPLPPGQGWWLFQATGDRTAGSGGIFRTPGNSLPDLSSNNSVTGQPIYEGNVWMADFSGGDLSDMFYNSGSAIEWLQNSGPPGGTFSSATSVYSTGSFTANIDPDFVDVGLDFNGSGRVGALVYNTGSGAWVGLNPSGNTLVSLGTISGASGHAAIPFDANGDGTTDLLTVASGGDWQLSLSEGTGFNTLSSSEAYSSSRDPLVVDYYGDGTQVAMVYNDSTSAWDILDAAYSVSTGNFSVSVTAGVAAPYNSTVLAGSLRVGSIESKGLDDLVYSVLGSGVYTWHYRLHQGAGSAYPDRVSQVADGLGNYCQFTYSTLADGTSFTRGSYTTYPVHSVQTSLPVVSTYVESDGIGGSYTFTYAYTDARVDTQGHGFLGFATRTVTDGRSGNVEKTTYDQTFPYIGMILQDQVKDSSGHLIRELDNSSPDQLSISPGPDSTQRYFPFFDTSTTHDYDNVSGTVQEVRTTVTTLATGDFDSYGNVTDETAVVTDHTQSGNPTYTTEQAATYATASSNYCVGLPASTTLTRTVPSSSLGATFTDPATRTATYGTDTADCRPTSQTVSDGSHSLATAYSYDAYGNVSETDVSGTGLPATRTTTFSNTGSNHEFQTQVTYAPTATTSFSTSAAWRYDLGVKTSDTDPNGKSTSVPTTAYDGAPGYDGFGRPHQQTRPDGSASAWNYAACASTGPFCPASAAYEVTMLQVSGVTAITTGYTAYDSMGRVVEQGTMLLGGVMSKVDTSYDQMGHIVKVSKPYLGSSPSYNTTYTYDLARNRVTALSTPQNASDSCSTSCADNVSYSYSGFTVTASHSVTDSASSSSTQVTQTIKDATDQILEVVDSNSGTTIYNYDAFGDLVATQDADGKVTTITYDGLGHKTGMVDPNMGTWSYSIDALGETLCQTDAKNQSIIMAYDNIGRVVSKLETAAGAGCGASSGYAGTWTYDASGALGLPAGVTDSNGFSRTYDYDSSDRVEDVSTTPGSGASTYTVTTGYDSFGRVQTITYPASVTPTSGGSTPTASASISPSTIVLGASVTLDGSASTDPNSLSLQYQWSQTGGPLLDVGAYDAAAESTSFTPSMPGIYSLQLVVVDSSSATSTPSPVSVTVKPVVPTGLAVTSANPSVNGSVSLGWTAVSPAADTYKIYQSTDNVTFTLATSVTGTTATITGLSNGTYYFEVSAVSNSVEGAKTSSVSEVVTLPPGAPTGMTVTPATQATSTNYTASWTAPATGTVTQYILQEDTSNTFPSPTTYTITAPTHSKVRSEATAGTYYYRVQACNGTASGACSGFSNTDNVVVLKIPLAPTLSASPTSITIGDSSTLTWVKHSGDTVTSYNVQNMGGTTVYSGSATSDVVSPHMTNTYKVQACNAAGCGAFSSGATITVSLEGGSGGFVWPQKEDPEAPTQLYAENAGDVGVEVVAQPVALTSNLTATKLGSVTPPALAHESGAIAALAQVAAKRQQLVAGSPKQPSEAALQARFDRLADSMPQTLALANPGKSRPAAAAGQPTYAPPVYAAYAGAKVHEAGGTPFRFVAQYNYDPASGALESVSNGDTGFIYWRAATDSGAAPVDAFGHIIAYVDGNNVSTVTAYDQATGAVIGIGTGIGGSSSVQQLAYGWDGFGNLKQRCDANRGLIENFGYDGLNRIASSNVYSGGTVGTCTASTAGAAMALTYDAVGNIQTRTNTGITVGGGTQNDTYTYGDSSHPNAVTGVTSISGSYAYDANGNMTSGNGRAITWNVDNLPSYISSSSTVDGNNTVTGTSTFSYGPDMQRYEQLATDSVAGNSTTLYIGGLFEVVSTSAGTEYRHNIVVNGGAVAVHTLDQSGNPSTTYIHADHLGSVDTFTDDTGTVSQQLSFDAFGLRRDPATWAYDLTGLQISTLKSDTDRGFTFQEQLDNLALVHMNGRVYDPTIGRFISADPTIPDPLYSQAFSRYTYVYNNALNSTDPSGYGGLLSYPDCSSGTCQLVLPKPYVDAGSNVLLGLILGGISVMGGIEELGGVAVLSTSIGDFVVDRGVFTATQKLASALAAAYTGGSYIGSGFTGEEAQDADVISAIIESLLPPSLASDAEVLKDLVDLRNAIKNKDIPKAVAALTDLAKKAQNAGKPSGSNAAGTPTNSNTNPQNPGDGSPPFGGAPIKIDPIGTVTVTMPTTPPPPPPPPPAPPPPPPDPTKSQ